MDESTPICDFCGEPISEIPMVRYPSPISGWGWPHSTVDRKFAVHFDPMPGHAAHEWCVQADAEEKELAEKAELRERQLATLHGLALLVISLLAGVGLGHLVTDVTGNGGAGAGIGFVAILGIPIYVFREPLFRSEESGWEDWDNY